MWSNVLNKCLCNRSDATSDTSLRTHPKFVVFLDQLLMLFNFCPSCKHDNPSVNTSVLGTMIQITVHCLHPQCKNPSFTWRSQPNMTGTKIPAGNFLLSFSTLVSGASPSKVFQVFGHMGLSCVSLRTYFRHQSVSFFITQHLCSCTVCVILKYPKYILQTVRNMVFVMFIMLFSEQTLSHRTLVLEKLPKWNAWKAEIHRKDIGTCWRWTPWQYGA